MTIERTPPEFASAHDNCIFTLHEDVKTLDHVTYPSYAYIADVYIGGSLITSLKGYPLPDTGRGWFNIGTIVRNYINNRFMPAEGQIIAQEFGLNDFYTPVTVKFGEEYGGARFLDVLVDEERLYFNHYNGRLVNKYTILDEYVNKICSNRVYKSTKLTLDCERHYIPFFSILTDDIILEIKTYDSLGDLISDENFFTITPSQDYTNQQINISPLAINNQIPGLIDSAVAFYEIVFIKEVNGDYPATSRTIKVDIYDEGKFQVHRIHFLNKLGGMESYDFHKLSRRKLQLEGQHIVVANYGSDGPVFSGAYKPHKYDSKFTESLMLNSDNMDENTYAWLSELLVSPYILLEDSGYMIPVRITNSEYEYKKHVNEKIFNLSIDITFDQTLNAQFI